MVRRAESTGRTRDAILDAVTRIFWDEPSRDMTLDRIADAARVTVQTVIRHFGGRDGAFEAAVEREMARVKDERDPAGASTPQAAVRQLVAHYERAGDQVLRLLAEEHRSPTVAAIVETGRAIHRNWCEQAFATSLAAMDAGSRRRRLAQLVAVCDVYTWKLLRRDARLDRRSTEVAMVELLSPLLEV
jgi:AcrR family transcriptional regulator